MQTLYEKIGESRLDLILTAFYDRVFNSPIIGPLFKGEKQEIKTKQFKFLCQFLGGPAYYSQEYGHPKMRMRHLAHPIDQAAKEEWLKLMHLSILEVIDDRDLAEALYNCFPPIAQHMVNRP